VSLQDSDLDALFFDMGIAVVFGSQSIYGILDQPGNDIDLRSLGKVATTDFELTYRTTALSPAPNVQDLITVDGASYIVRDVSALDDGKLTKLGLKTK
jgi:hypothetical protein